MRKRRDITIYIFIVLIVIFFFVLIISDNNGNINLVNERNNIHSLFTFNQVTEFGEPCLSIEINDDGYDIYEPKGKGYRYGPSIIYYEDGTMDAWFASNGNIREWDWITYRHFDGQQWDKEKIVLTPTRNSADKYSTCDPGVIYFNGYYYLGYTSTINANNGGVENCGFVARSKNPDGPYEKWNGNGWGGRPQAIISYDNKDGYWGAGELTFVIVDEKLYCYYTWICEDGNYTKLAIAELVDDWPTTLKDQGIVIERVNEQGSGDVIYNDDYESFLMLCVESSFSNYSSIAVYESKDGINFEQVAKVEDKVCACAHNMGVSKKPDGHVDFKDNLIIGYAYSKDKSNVWGKWNTRIQNINLKLTKK